MTSSETEYDGPTRRAVQSGLDPRGFPVRPTGLQTRSNPVVAPEWAEDFIPWGTPASEIGEEDDEEDPLEYDVDDWSLFDWLDNLAEAQGLSTPEYMEYIGRPFHESDDDDDEDEVP